MCLVHFVEAEFRGYIFWYNRGRDNTVTIYMHEETPWFDIELLAHQVISQIGYLWRSMKHNSGGNLRSTTLKLSFPGTAFVEMNKEKKEKESQ